MIESKKYTPFTTNEIKARGWLYDQLKIQADGLSGNLHRVWPDIRDSQWIGGECEGWERVPYWLDGFIPLAYLLDDEDMKATAKKYVDFIISKQIVSETPIDNGWICPCKDEAELLAFDEWAVLLICKALIVYYECSEDSRIQDVVYKILYNLKWRLEHFAIHSWGSYRWYEGLISIYWLYERVHEEWLIDFAHLLYEQGNDYNKILKFWRDDEPKGTWKLSTHVVNLAMALKSEALFSLLLNSEGENIDPDEFAESLLAKLTEHHGNVTGYFNGDECLCGTSPIHGTELCGIVEAMYSYEILFQITGKTKWLDRAEMLGYNALPAAMSEDMWVRQYDQMSNQIACPHFKEKSPFMTNGLDGNMFGLESNYGCCTANFHQGFPKLALSTFMRSQNGIVSAVLAPSSLECDVNGVGVKITLDTLYPFRDTLTYTIETEKPVKFDFEIRIPSGINCATVDGAPAKSGTVYKISREWSESETVVMKLDYRTELMFRPNDLFALRRGMLIYSLPVKEKWKKHEYTDQGIERKFPYCDYEVTPKSKWNYSFADTDFRFVENDNYDKPFSTKNPPIYATCNMCEINWGFEEGYDNVCRAVPLEREPLTSPRRMKLLPYGSPKLRMTEMPVQKLKI